MNIVTMTFFEKGAVPMHANLVFKLFFTSSCFLNNYFVQSEQLYSSDKYHRVLHLVSFMFFIVN